MKKSILSESNQLLEQISPALFVAGIIFIGSSLKRRIKAAGNAVNGKHSVDLMKMLARKNEELRKSEEQYHKLVSEVKDYAIFLLNRNGIIQNWNLGAEKIKGYSQDEIIGKNFSIFYTPEDRENQLPQKLLRQAAEMGTVSSEGWRVRKNGTTFWAHVVITAIHSDAGDVIGFSKVTHDITDKRKLENQMKNYALQLEESNKQLQQSIQELESFSYIASHDLKEPLRKIQTFANRLLEKETGALSENGREYFHRIVESASHMQQLIDDLLSFSQATTSGLEFKNVDLNELLGDVTTNLKLPIEENHAVIKARKLPVVRAIPFQIEQVFQNLISNSIKYRKQEADPKINIKADEVLGTEIEDRNAEPLLKYVRISFKDNGIGFDQQHEYRIFELFQRLHGKDKYSGSGLGLAICKKIMENHGGFMKALGRAGSGATFEIFLPDRGHVGELKEIS